MKRSLHGRYVRARRRHVREIRRQARMMRTVAKLPNCDRTMGMWLADSWETQMLEHNAERASQQVDFLLRSGEER